MKIFPVLNNGVPLLKAKAIAICPTKGLIILLPCSLPSGEICPACEKSPGKGKGRCNFSIIDPALINIFCRLYGIRGVVTTYGETSQLPCLKCGNIPESCGSLIAWPALG